MKCVWEKDVHGFYVLPLLGISKVKKTWSIWFGWGYWLFTWQLTRQ